MPARKKKADPEEEVEEEEEGDESEFLSSAVFAISGKLSRTQAAMKKLISDNGGTVAGSVTKKVTHLISTKEELEDGSDKIDKAKENGIFIVSEEFIDECVKQKKMVAEAPFLLTGAAGKEEKEKEAEEEEEEEEEEEKPKKKRAASGAAEGEKESKRAKKDDDEEPEVKAKVIVKGRAAVDAVSGKADTCHVYEEGDCVYDCMLNQTNIGSNNNKFYVIQVLKEDSGNSYYVWNRWGRVGERGQFKLMPCGSNLQKAKSDFEKKFKDKTVNLWANRNKFVKHAGKYDLIAIDYGVGDDEEEEDKKKQQLKKEAAAKAANKKSELDERLQDLIRLIFDMKMMERVMQEMEFDVKKSPLGKLTKEQIRKGYLVLQKIEHEIARANRDALQALSSEFYTLIPHNFGRVRPPVIGDAETLKKKMQMLEALADIEIAAKIIADVSGDENQLDSNYRRLNALIEPVDEDSEEHKYISRYVANTHPRNTPRIKQVFKLQRAGEADRFAPKKGLGNRMLLWHGSRLTNFVGILSQGLRIAPPEAPASGYRFGKGVYFADICGLASRYCRSAGDQDFLMLLGDVALGKTADLVRDTYMEKPQAGTNSTKALGTIEPDPKDRLVLQPDDVVVPYGKIVDSGHKGVSCQEHQYIVYDVAQVELKYLVRFAN
eukprot:m51a1_g9470 hypothetical protein (661) ;mRNA; f:574726-577270